MATHVLTSVDWGATCTVTVEYESGNLEVKEQVEGALSAEVKALKGILDKVSGLFIKIRPSPLIQISS